MSALRKSLDQAPLDDPGAGIPTQPPDAEHELWEFAYYSSACFAHEDADLRRLVRSASERNRSLGVTGMLVYWNQSFFQVLEGPRSTVEGVLETFIRPSQSHSGIIQAHAGVVAERTFPTWAMAARVASDKEIMCIEKLIERSESKRSLEDGEPVGSILLQAFLSAAGRLIG